MTGTERPRMELSLNTLSDHYSEQLDLSKGVNFEEAKWHNPKTNILDLLLALVGLRIVQVLMDEIQTSNEPDSLTTGNQYVQITHELQAIDMHKISMNLDIPAYRLLLGHPRIKSMIPQQSRQSLGWLLEI